MPQPPEVHHLSHSQRETLKRCAKSWFLEKVAKVPQWPALWSAGGSAVHTVTENWDRHFERYGEGWIPKDVHLQWNQAFDAEVAELEATGYQPHQWRQSKSEPVEVWRTQGLTFVKAYIAWRERSPWKIWTTPDGVPAIELDVRGFLPGCPVEIQAYVDRVFVDPVFDDQLWILDLKTGTRAPTSADQFGVYAALIKAKYGVPVRKGVAFLNRKATLGKPFDLDDYTPEAVGETFGEAYELIQAGDFKADTSDCFICSVQHACAARNGPDAPRYDPDSPGYLNPIYPF